METFWAIINGETIDRKDFFRGRLAYETVIGFHYYNVRRYFFFVNYRWSIMSMKVIISPYRYLRLNYIGSRMFMEYSIVIPLKDEEGNVRNLVEEIEAVMHGEGKPWELICVDDGSSDQTLSILRELSHTKPFLRIVVFKRNFGQSSAFDAGFKKARGTFVITLDGDRQNDPSDIPGLIQLSNDYDLVCGIRQKRQDSLIKKTTSFFANKIRSKVCQDGVEDTGCSLKLYRRSCLDSIKLYNGMHRFLPALFQIEGYKITQIPVKHRQRVSGKTKYNFLNRSFNTIADMLAVRWMRKRQLNYEIEREF